MNTNINPNAKSARDSLELIIIVFAVAIAHLLPFGGAFGCPLFAVDGCETIAVVFSFLAAFMLTARVAFHDNKWMSTSDIAHPCLVEAIGAAVVLAWFAPFYAVFHGMAEASIAAIGIATSILASAAVSKSTSWLQLGHDLASVLVVVVAIAWAQTVPHFNDTPHGEQFVAGVAIGSSSLHSIRTVIETVAKWLAR